MHDADVADGDRGDHAQACVQLRQRRRVADGHLAQLKHLIRSGAKPEMIIVGIDDLAMFGLYRQWEGKIVEDWEIPRDAAEAATAAGMVRGDADPAVGHAAGDSPVDPRAGV